MESPPRDPAEREPSGPVGSSLHVAAGARGHGRGQWERAGSKIQTGGAAELRVQAERSPWICQLNRPTGPAALGEAGGGASAVVSAVTAESE